MRISIRDYAAAAAVATELVNGSPSVRGAAGDALPDPGALAEFLAGHDVPLDAPGARNPTATDLHQVRLLRRDVRAVLAAATEDDAVAAAGVLAGWAGLAPVLGRDTDGGWRWEVPTRAGAPLVAELAAFVGIGLLGVMRALGHDRFRACAAPGCRGVFADTSRAGRRRYCTPDACGNRVNVANHRARRTTEIKEGSPR
ncbi:CGNR zinc finger domain-containing protein [Spongiactinospora sp. 9N601]|uniref:CGNR zinc finger domain-containing protein n=1 Tax=Spongiactinospora sp. 9N601 TaxID=3375149 RepID=UPI00379A02D9